jgi:hypothetical protein
LFVFNAISSPALDYRFISLNTGGFLELLHTNYIVCVYCMQQNTKNKENQAKIIKNA